MYSEKVSRTVNENLQGTTQRLMSFEEGAKGSMVVVCSYCAKLSPSSLCSRSAVKSVF